MSRFIFIHDFYRDGYNDMLAEVHVLRESGQWTKERRANVTRHEVSSYKALKRNFPRMDTSYWAGRVAALRSAITARYSAQGLETCRKVIFLPLPDELIAFCGSCGDRAMWRYTKEDKAPLIWYRCDRCKQELVREQTAYIMPDGWDWDSDEDSLLPVPVGNKLMVKEQLEPVSIFLPCTTVVGLGLLDMTLHIPILLFVTQAVLLLHFMIWGKNALLKVCKWLLESEL